MDEEIKKLADELKDHTTLKGEQKKHVNKEKNEITDERN